MNVRVVMRIVLSTLVLGVAVWYVLRGVDLDLVSIGLRNANLWLVGVATALVLAAHVVRAIRWQMLLRPVAPTVPFTSAFNAVMIGYAANTIVPRSGEVIRPVILGKRCSVPVGTTMSSVLVERVLDVVTLLVAIVIVVVLAPSEISAVVPGFTVTRTILTIAVPIAAIASAVVFVVFTDRGRIIIGSMSARAGERVHAKVGSILDAVRDGMAAVRRPSLYVGITLTSMGIWLFYILPVWLVAKALPFPAAQEMSLATAAILLVIIAIGVTIAPTPGALGIYQTFAQQAYVALTGGTPTDGLVFGILSWIVNYGSAFIVGGIAWLIEARHGLSRNDLRTESTHP